jgi:N-acetylmuramate 1-kinase
MQSSPSARLQQINEFLATTSFSNAQLLPLAGDASFRRYIRVRQGDQCTMLMDAPPEKENARAYLVIAEHLYRHGYSAPAILAADPQAGLLLLEDLGDDLFTTVLRHSDAKARPALEHTLYAAAIDLVAEWHQRNKELANPSALLLPVYNETLLLQEVGLFADWYLPQALGKERAASLRPEYMALWQKIIARAPLATDQWVHRDYHADNLIWLPRRSGMQRVGLLDFQDGVYGDAAYDLVSLLEDARRDVPEALVEEMLARYLNASGADRTRFAEAYAVLGAQRNSKIVGIFVRLAARDNKFAYLSHLPRVWRYLERDLAHPALGELKRWLDRHVAAGQRGIIEVTPAAPARAATA